MAKIEYIDDTNHAVLMRDSASGLIGSKIKFNNDVDKMISTYESEGYQLVSNNFQPGQTFQPDVSQNSFQVHFKKAANQPNPNGQPVPNSYRQDLVFRNLNGDEIKRCPSEFAGQLTDGKAIISSQKIEAAIAANLPAGYKRLSGAFNGEQIKTGHPHSIEVYLAPSKNEQQKQASNAYYQSIVFQTPDGQIVNTATNVISGQLVNGQANIPLGKINQLIDQTLPQGYSYVSGKLVQPELISDPNPAPLIVIVDSLHFQQDIVYQLGDGSIVKTVPKAITGLLKNSQATISAAEINSKIDLHRPNGYAYISGKAAADEVVNSQKLPAIRVVVQNQQTSQPNFSQNLIYKTGDDRIIKTVPSAITGSLSNQQAQVAADDINRKIEANLPAGYEYISGKATAPEQITGSMPPAINVVIKAIDQARPRINPGQPVNNWQPPYQANPNYQPTGPGTNLGNVANNNYYQPNGYQPGFNQQPGQQPNQPNQGINSASYLNHLAQVINQEQQGQVNPAQLSDDDASLMTMALGLGAMLLSGGLAGLDRYRHH